MHRVARATVPDPVPTPPDIAPYAAQAHTVDIHLTDGSILSGHRTPVEAFAPERNPAGDEKLREAAAFSQALAPDEVERIRRYVREPGAAKTVGDLLSASRQQDRAPCRPADEQSIRTWMNTEMDAHEAHEGTRRADNSENADERGQYIDG